MLRHAIKIIIAFSLPFTSSSVLAQTAREPGKRPDDKDTVFIRPLIFPNEIRILYGTKASSLTYGSSRQGGNTSWNYFNNVSDLISIGMTYKFIDFDVAYTLPKTRLMDEGIQNLQQFRLSGSYFGSRWTVQGYWRNSQGMVASDAGGTFQSTPDLHMVVLSVQATYNFNYKRYSFKSANFQNERQLKSAGSFLLRIEPYYRNIGVSTLVPPAKDLPSVYGEQAGLTYVRSPGINILPGYGYNWAFHDGLFFISPIVMAGGGLAVTSYRSTEDHSILNAEWTWSASLNGGYNGRRIYAVLRGYYETHYFNLNPSYFTTSDIRIGITFGYRFGDLEKSIPRF